MHKKFLREFLLLTIGSAMTAVGIYFFKFPNNFTTGGVSGISVILGSLVPFLSAGSFVLIINMALLLLGFLILGRSFGLKTVYCTVLMSVLTYVLEWVCPMEAPLTSQPLLELVFAIFLPAVGSAILFYIGASTGGTDIVAMIIKKYTHINISRALFFSDLLIVMASFLVFGIETWLFSLLGFLSKVFLVNNVLESINMSKFCTVITTPECEERLCRFITDELHKSATVSEAYVGAYHREKKAVLLVALTRSQTARLKRYAATLPDKTFIIISNTSDILGRGFRETI